MTLQKLGRQGLVLALAGAMFGAPPHQDVDPPTVDRPTLGGLFVMFSANAPRDAPHLFFRYFRAHDYARLESLPARKRVPRRRVYVLPTTVRARWRGQPGVRHWTDKGCGPGSPGTIVYDPERRELTPPAEQRTLAASARRAARLVRATGCHGFGLAPGPQLLFGLDPDTCTYDLDDGVYRQIPWRSVELVDIQAQRLLGDDCVEHGGVRRYAAAVTSLAGFLERRAPGVAVVTQVSFRDSSPGRMKRAIALVAPAIDGIYFSYPSRNPRTPCRYCSPGALEDLLAYLRPADGEGRS